MPTRTTTRYCADPDALALMRRDGIGWGHDLDCGCFRTDRPPTPGPLARFVTSLKRRK